MALDYIPLPEPQIDNIQGVSNIGFLHYNPDIFTLIVNITNSEIDSGGLLEELQKIDIRLNKVCYLESLGHRFKITHNGIEYNRGKGWENWNISVSMFLVTKTVYITKITPCDEGLALQVLGKDAILSWYDLRGIFLSLKNDSTYDRDKYGSNKKHTINLIVEKMPLK